MSMLEGRGGKEGDSGGGKEGDGGRDRQGREGRRWEACSDQDLKWGWGGGDTGWACMHAKHFQ